MRMRLHHTFGIDIGTSTIKVFDERNDQILKEHNMIAIREGSSVYTVGNEAYRIYGRTPANIRVGTPMSGGRISDVQSMQTVLRHVLNRAEGRVGYDPTLFFTVPTDLTAIERRAYQTIAHSGFLRRSRFFFVEKPIADAIAFGIPLSRTAGSMLVNIGAQSTDIAVVADSRIIISSTLPIGGHSINRAIVAGVRRRNQFVISDRTAKRLKLSLTDLSGNKMEARKVAGIDTNNSLPRNGIVTTYTVTNAVRQEVRLITDEIAKFLKRIPPQIRSSILEEGIYLSGGSTRITGLPEFLNENLESAVRISGNYDLHTACGLRELIAHEDLHRWAAPGGKR